MFTNFEFDNIAMSWTSHNETICIIIEAGLWTTPSGSGWNRKKETEYYRQLPSMNKTIDRNTINKLTKILI